MIDGGRIALRGFLIQTLIGVLDALETDHAWTAVTLEPDVESEKVDILWEYRGRTKVVQVKSTKNEFGKADVQRWATELQDSNPGSECQLVLVGMVRPAAIPDGDRIGDVHVRRVVSNLELTGLKEQATFRVQRFLEQYGLPKPDADGQMRLVSLLTENFATESVSGRRLSRTGLLGLLTSWCIERSDRQRVIRVHVSMPEELVEHRKALEHSVRQTNNIEAAPRRVCLQTRVWDGTRSAVTGDQATSDDPAVIAELFLGIVDQRLGPNEAGYGTGSEKEFREAAEQWGQLGRPWITFYFDDGPMDSRKTESVREYLKVCDLREKLESRRLVEGYTGIFGADGTLHAQVDKHLRTVLNLLAPPHGAPATKPADPTLYLKDLEAKTAQIEIRGLQVGKGRANRFPIEELYISLTTTAMPDGSLDGSEDPRPRDIEATRAVPLQQGLRHDRLVVVGDAGSGKTTFLRRVAQAMCQTQLGQQPAAAEDRLGFHDRTFPLFVRISELAQHLVRHADSPNAPAGEDAPAWLPHYLAAASDGNHFGLDAEYFLRQLNSGVCTVLLDGLDEAPDRRVRERMSRLIENVTRTHRDCRFVVTSRPAAYRGDVVLPEFAHARIDPLSDEAVKTFVGRWCSAIYHESPTSARDHCEELLSALRGRLEIRRMARNPVMLTALAVVHWNEKRLPEQRADLYHSIITWLSRSREERPGRETADHTVVLLQELALVMQDDAGGRKTQVAKRWAAERIAGEIGGTVDKNTVEQAERFLDEEEVDSGIVVGRGNELTFWHLTFQHGSKRTGIIAERRCEPPVPRRSAATE